MEPARIKQAQPYEIQPVQQFHSEAVRHRNWYNTDGAERALTSGGQINPFYLFQRLTGCFADQRRYDEFIDCSVFRQRLSEKFPEAYHNGVYSRKYDLNAGTYYIEDATWWINDQLMVVMRNYAFEKSVVILFGPATNSSLLMAVTMIAESSMVPRNKQKIHLITYHHNEYQLRPFEVRCPEINLGLHYGDGFEAVHHGIFERLNTPNDKGIVLLHGIPGTGKTTYIRYLISTLQKKVIYLPPDLADLVARPDFLNFLLDHPDSVLVIEDAERVVEQRKGNNNAISNILNLCDGLLADCLSIQVVCTFNLPLTGVDKALLRGGRLIAKHEFRELNLDQTNMLLQKVNGEESSKPLTLSEIFHHRVKHEEQPNIPRRLGFRSEY